jgi:hypothetical protein
MALSEEGRDRTSVNSGDRRADLSVTPLSQKRTANVRVSTGPKR